MKQFGFALSEAGEELSLDIYSSIGESFWFDSVSANSVLRRLKGSQGKAKTINVGIHSDGGDVFEASDIYFQLAEHPARKVVRIGGLAASAASFVAMVGDEIIMGPAGWMMIHNPWGGAEGPAEKLIGWGETLLKARETYASIYAARSKQSKEKVLELMAAESWLTAEEAVKLGFADRIEHALDAPAEAKVKARAARAFAAASLNDFSNVPEAVRALMSTARGELELERRPAQQQPAPEPKTPPAPEARKPTPNLGEEQSNMALSKLLITALALAEDADESTAVAAVNKIKASAKLGSSVEELLGVSGQAALGAVRALKENSEANAELGTEVAKLKIVNARRDFDSIVAGATKPDYRKLTPAMVKMYTERFDKAVKLAEGEGGNADAAHAKAQDICEELRGFVAIAPRIGSGNINPPTGNGGTAPGEGAAMQHNGKTFEAMEPRDRLNLKNENPDVYNAMREDAQARGAI